MSDQSTPAKSAKKGARRSSADLAIIKDAKVAYAAGVKYRKQLEAADAKKKLKVLPPAFWAEYKTNLSAATGTRTVVATAKVSAKSATKKEATLRKSLSELLVEIRDEVGQSFPDDRDVRSAFGVGKRVTRDSTPQLIELAEATIGAMAGDYAKAAKDAGVASLRKKLEQSRDALAAADQGQQSAQGARKGAAQGSRKVIEALRKAASRLRTRAKTVFRGQADVLAAFADSRPRTAKRRSKLTTKK